MESKNKKVPKLISVGAMIETPAAVLAIKKIVRLADFISIGTNDLLQYTMVADREKVSVSKYYEMGHSLIMPWIREVLEAAEERVIESAICGELARGPFHIRQLLKLGYRNFSVTPQFVPKLKYDIMSLLSGKQRKVNPQCLDKL